MIIRNEDTICAVATAPGGALGIVRVSGSDAIALTDKVFVPFSNPNIPLSNRNPYSLVYGKILDEKKEVLDEVMAGVYRAPHSYTGEDSVEITCHGSFYILQQINQLFIQQGCRAAEPGEFTQRAFLNGKMDLCRAEAVADLIAASSAAAHRTAMNQMRGGFSRTLSQLRDKLLKLTALIELELDFSDHEDVEFADRTELRQTAEEIEGIISRLTQSFSVGNVLKNGVPTVIVGETNSGKSTLLNALLHEDRAIVSSISGTTRDVIEDTIVLNGITFRFIDTAGIRDTADEIESMGIERSIRKMEQAHIVLWVVDVTDAQTQINRLADCIFSKCKDKKLFILLNKIDVTDRKTPTLVHIPKSINIVPISAKMNIGIDRLQHLLVRAAALPEINSTDVIVTNTRHYEALTLALADIRRVLNGLRTGLSGDFISQDLRSCLFHLAEIAGGQITTDEVLGSIFKHFCIGK